MGLAGFLVHVLKEFSQAVMMGESFDGLRPSLRDSDEFFKPGLKNQAPSLVRVERHRPEASHDRPHGLRESFLAAAEVFPAQAAYGPLGHFTRRVHSPDHPSLIVPCLPLPQFSAPAALPGDHMLPPYQMAR